MQLFPFLGIALLKFEVESTGVVIMRVPTFATAAFTALSLVAAPTVAAAAPVATKLSVSTPVARVGANVAVASQARGSDGKRRGAGLIIAILAAAAIIAGIIIAADNNDNPTSR